jgi:hypothetical protein
MYFVSDRIHAQMNNKKVPPAGLLLSLFKFRVICIASSNLAFSRFSYPKSERRVKQD